MSHWNVKTSALYILGCVVFIMLLIVVLPFIDLPDTAFHRGTAPIVVHAQVTNAPAAATVATVLLLADSEPSHLFTDSGVPSLNPDPNFRPILLRSLRW